MGPWEGKHPLDQFEILPPPCSISKVKSNKSVCFDFAPGDFCRHQYRPS